LNIVALVEAENHVCCRYRIAAFRPYWEAAGHTLTIQPLGKSFRERWKAIRSVRDFDLVILQRKLVSGWETKLLRKRARRLVFDFDDAIWLRDSYSRKGFGSPKRLRRFARIAECADTLVVGNRFLGEQAGLFTKRASIVEIPTCIEPDKYAPLWHDRSPGEMKIVWVGSSSTLQGIEQQHALFDGIAEAIPGMKFKIICDRFPKFDKMPVEEVRWNEATEAAELADVDIGIGWVPDDPWSRGKCGLKLLQYQAAGLVAIANPVGVQAEIVKHGETGLLATTPDEWLNAVSVLANQPELRRQLGQAGRSQVESAYSVAAGARTWLELFARS
jgi:glycosyltransferase involved in cell wall biosynthesis